MRSDSYDNRLNQAAFGNTSNNLNHSGVDYPTVLDNTNRTLISSGSSIASKTMNTSNSCGCNSLVITNQSCKRSMQEALGLLCNTKISNRIDFDKFGFITDNYLVGTQRNLLPPTTTPHDNLTELTGSFRRFSPNSCDLIEINGTVYYDIPAIASADELNEWLRGILTAVIDALDDQEGFIGTLVTLLGELLAYLQTDAGETNIDSIYLYVQQLLSPLMQICEASLATLNSIAFEIKTVVGTDTTGSETTENLTNMSYQYTKRLLQRELSSTFDRCGESSDCASNHNNCCQNNILTELLSSNLSHRASVAAGPLVLTDITVLGATGNVIVFANDQQRRFYFVCADAIELLR